MKDFSLLISLFVIFSYFETVFKIVSGYALTINSYLDIVLISTIFFCIVKLFSSKIQKIVSILLVILVYVLYGVQICVKSLFGLYFDFDLLSIAGQVGAFWKEGIFLVLSNWWKLLIMLIPVVLFIVFNRFISYRKYQYRFLFLFPICLVVMMFACVPRIDSKTEVVIANYDVLTCFFNDMKAKEETELVVNDDSEKSPVKDYSSIEFAYDIDFDSLESDDATITKLNNYFGSQTAITSNDATGYFEGKNLILILGESFNEIGIKEDLTPTLYKMLQGSFNFTNYYSSSYNSTVGGEFQLLNSMYADSSSLGIWKAGTNAFPFSAANLFREAGYSTYAYHDNDYTYMNRDVYLNAYGFDNYEGCGNGLETKMACDIWPESDEEMMKATIDDYIYDEHFFTYYVSVSGHGPYTLDSSRNELDSKYYDYVQSLGYNYSEKVTCYLASMVELDHAMEYLLDSLEQAGKLDDTVIVIAGDHYPYFLEDPEYIEYMGRSYEQTIEVCENALIIYNPSQEPLTCDKVGQTMDVMPTLYNLFNINYDSRLVIGKDLFSNATGMALFGNGSWVSNDGIYYANTGEFVPDKDVSDERYEYLSSYADTQMAMTNLIFDSDYYRYIEQYIKKD